MRIVRFETAGTTRFGVLEGDDVVDMTGVAGHLTVSSLLRADDLHQLRATAGRDRWRRSDIVLLPPVDNGRAVFCIGVNYAERNEEYGDLAPAPAYPSLFLRHGRSFVGHDTPLERPSVSEQLDYEGEIALIIGRGGRAISRGDALGHVAGLTLANEGSVRDWLRHSKFNVTQGKNFDRSGSIGPWMVTADELDTAGPLHLMTRVNGEQRQDANTQQMLFPFDHLIAYLSTFATLEPGDVILTGTPTGAGARMTPPRWLVPGDVVEVEVPGLGVLRNGVIDGP